MKMPQTQNLREVDSSREEGCSGEGGTSMVPRVESYIPRLGEDFCWRGKVITWVLGRLGL